MNQLSDYLPEMQTTNVLASTEKAKMQARTLLEDQGIAVMALLLADFMSETIRQNTSEALFTSLLKNRVPA